MKLRFVLPITALVLVGCVDVSLRDSELERLADRLSNLADACLIDVRDKNVPYLNSTNCVGMGEASASYLSRGGVQLTYTEQAAPRHAYTAVSAKSTAWSAAALSNAFHRNRPPVVALW